jgi:Cu/Ag efflux protein CusF
VSGAIRLTIFFQVGKGRLPRRPDLRNLLIAFSLARVFRRLTLQFHYRIIGRNQTLNIWLVTFLSSVRQCGLALVLIPAVAMTACNRDSVTGNAASQANAASSPAAPVMAPTVAPPNPPVTGTSKAPEPAIYQGVGVVKSLNATRPSIEIDHEEIKGMMPAMTMEFYVKRESMLTGIKAGDRIEFTVQNGVGGVQIIKIKKLSAQS